MPTRNVFGGGAYGVTRDGFLFAVFLSKEIADLYAMSMQAYGLQYKMKVIPVTVRIDVQEETE